ncbi:hypothetical protein [Desulfovibrio ferrophilus]|uniref:Type VI secretion system spike protein VgrG3-like C-terminal domain-containing protein n=1 Tax=Desulfovibrio ferrophilus TaxID=241368 RepID=A0A2Z6B3N3_9BACT|nr:hypothetical protein [Desulfovibrio ferrophilus]BBD10065.1 uncharacterized protein DFE_3339 [Desulfovibrio ferrophilus]
MSINPIKFIPIKPMEFSREGFGGQGAVGTGLPDLSGKAGAFAKMLQSALKTGGVEALDLAAQLSMGGQFMSLMQGGDASKLAETGEMNQLLDALSNTSDKPGGGMDFTKLMGGIGGNNRSLDLMGLVGSAIPGVDMSKVAEALKTNASQQELAPQTAMNGVVPEADELAGMSEVAANPARNEPSLFSMDAPSAVQKPAMGIPIKPMDASVQAMINAPEARPSASLRAARTAMAHKAYGAAPASDPFGVLSARFESGGNPGSVGYDRVGGTSYGMYQVSSRAGTFDRFLNFLDAKAPEMASRLRAAGQADTGSKTGPMPSAWKTLAHDEGPRFSNLQHEFIRETHFQPALKKVAELTGVDLTGRHQAIAQVLWSTAVQHGATGSAKIFAKALDAVGNIDGPGFEKELIKAVYDNRSRQFGSSSERVQGAVSSRFKNELRDVMSLLEGSSILDSNA